MDISTRLGGWQNVYTVDEAGRYAEQKQAHAAAQKVGTKSFREVMDDLENDYSSGKFPEGAQILKFTLLPDFNRKGFTHTGDEGFDKDIENGLKYKASCFDLTHCNEFDELTMDSDYTGMTAVEKYKAIYERYQYCFGENFLDARAVMYNSPYVRSEDPYKQVIRMFNNEIEAACGKDNLREIRREALYGGMRDDEIMQAIMEKYDPDGRSMTFRQLCKATLEMDMCGVSDEVNGILCEELLFDYQSGMDTELLLDSPLTVGLLKSINDWSHALNPIPFGITGKTFAALNYITDYVKRQLKDHDGIAFDSLLGMAAV